MQLIVRRALLRGALPLPYCLNLFLKCKFLTKGFFFRDFTLAIAQHIDDLSDDER